jgi:uncharacterized membrane protein
MKTLREFMLRPWFYLFIVLIGISLKFYRIDYRYFWYDEVCTVMHTSGMNGRTYLENLPVNELKSIGYYHDLLKLNKPEITIQSQLKGIWNMPNLNPLHYAVLVFWHRIAGDDDIHFRYFNIFIFLLTLPFLFGLAKILFKSDLAGWLAVSLFAVSPFFQNYTFEARYNILCTFLIIVNQYFFLKALEKKGMAWWTGYLISGILCLYASFNLWLLFMAHFIYVLIYYRKVLVPYFISSFLIVLGYLPWFISVFNNLNEIKGALAWHEWYGTNQNAVSLILAQLYFAAYSFVTFNEFFAQTSMFMYHQFEGNFIQLIVSILITGLLIYSVVYTYKRAGKKVFAFVLLLTLPQFIYFYITDLVRHTGISLIWRYNNLVVLGFIFFLVFLFYDKLALKRKTFFIIPLALLILGIISNFYMSDKHYYNMYEKELSNSALLSACEKPLLISDFNTVFAGGDAADILTFTNACKSGNLDILRVKADIQNITAYFDSDKYSDILILHGSEELIQNLKSQFGYEMDSIQMIGFVNEWRVLPSHLSEISTSE